VVSRLLLAVALVVGPAALVGQVATVAPDTVVKPSPSVEDAVGAAHDAQARFEWYPREEAAEIVEARMELLSELDSLQHLSSTDGWILGQRVWYRGETGDCRSTRGGPGA